MLDSMECCWVVQTLDKNDIFELFLARDDCGMISSVTASTRTRAWRRSGPEPELLIWIEL